MKTRIVQTRFWDDPVVMECSKEATLLWIYLITNKELGMTNYVHIPDQFLGIYTKLTKNELEKAKIELEATQKMYFFNGWIFYPKLEDENKYKNSPKNAPTYERELEKIPNDVKAYFTKVYTSIDTTTDSTMPSSRHSNHKSKIKNHKSKIINKKQSDTSIDSTMVLFEEFWQKYPRKVNKKKTSEKYGKIVDKHEEIMAGLERHLPMWSKTDPQYIPHPYTWLYNERWNDEVKTGKKNFESENSKAYENLF